MPVGVLLSGGVDSGALAALAAQESSGPVRTFSIGFEEAPSTSSRTRGAVAARYGTDHHELVSAGRGGAPPALAEAFDEPFADSSALPTYLVSQLAAEDVKVALSGEGGDELFGGYYTYVADRLAERVGPLRALRARSSSGCRARSAGELRLRGQALRARARTCRRSSATTAGRRSSPPRRAPS